MNSANSNYNSTNTEQNGRQEEISLDSGSAYAVVNRIQIPNKSTILTNKGRVIHLDHPAVGRMQAPSAKSKKTMSNYNQTPREQ